MFVNFFEKIDLLGSNFHFYDGVSLKKRTIIGGILTFIIGIFSIYFFIIFSKDLFMKLNPNITITIQNNSLYEYIDLKKENIIFAFRIEDYYGNFYNESNILYIKIIYYKSNLNDNGKYKRNLTSELINYHLCNESDFKNENLTQIYGNLFCPEFEGKQLGGYWDNSDIHYFDFQVYFCKNGSNYSLNNNCTSIKTLRSIFNQEKPIYFSFYYPVIEFDPLSYNYPLKIRYKNYNYDLNHKIQKSDSFILKKTILNDDKGWLLNNIKNLSFWGIEQITFSYKFFTEEELNNEGVSSKIYSLSIYNTAEHNYYKRYYTKFQNVFAIIGSLINLIFYLCSFITHYIGESIRKLDVLNSFFDFEDKKDCDFNFKTIKRNYTYDIFPYKNSSMNHNNEKKSIKKNHCMITHSKTTLFNVFDNKKEFMKLKLNKLKEKRINLHKKNIQKKNDTIDYSNSKVYLKRKSLPVSSTKGISYENLNFLKSNLTLKHILAENIILYIFFCCSNRKLYTHYFNTKHSNLLQYYYINIIQINRYLKIIHEYYFLKKAFLNNSQIRSLLFLKRINLTNKEERESISENNGDIHVEQNVIDYFKSQISMNYLSKIDQFIFKNLNENIKSKII